MQGERTGESRAASRDGWVVSFEDARRALTGLSVLYFGDDAESGGRIFMSLGQAGARVRLARRLVQGFQLLEALRPRLVIIDGDSSEMDMTELVRELRRRPASASALLVVLSSRDGRAMRRRAKAMGADGFLPKPIDLRVCAQTLVRDLPALAERSTLAASG